MVISILEKQAKHHQSVLSNIANLVYAYFAATEIFSSEV